MDKHGKFEADGHVQLQETGGVHRLNGTSCHAFFRAVDEGVSLRIAVEGMARDGGHRLPPGCVERDAEHSNRAGSSTPGEATSAPQGHVDGDRAVLSHRVGGEPFQLLVESAGECASRTMDAHGCLEPWKAGTEKLEGYRAEEAPRHGILVRSRLEIAELPPSQGRA